MRVLALGLVAALALAGCNSADDAPFGDVPDPAAEPVCITGDTFQTVEEFVGLTEAEAVALAEEQRLVVREVGRDGECFPVTDDFSEDRINLEFQRDRVVAAARY
jgi:hypothetical protein